MAEDFVKSLADLLEREYGVRTAHRINPTGNVAFVAAVQPVLGSNPKRLGFVVVNMGAAPLWIAPRDAVADDYGIELVANGGTLNMKWSEDFEMVSLPYYGISNAAGTDIFVMEVMIF